MQTLLRKAVDPVWGLNPGPSCSEAAASATHRAMKMAFVDIDSHMSPYLMFLSIFGDRLPSVKGAYLSITRQLWYRSFLSEETLKTGSHFCLLKPNSTLAEPSDFGSILGHIFPFLSRGFLIGIKDHVPQFVYTDPSQTWVLSGVNGSLGLSAEIIIPTW